MTNQIFVAVADGSQRQWTKAETNLIIDNPELVNQLKGWLENSLSDGCWHPENYKLIRDLSVFYVDLKSVAIADEEIPF